MRAIFVAVVLSLVGVGCASSTEIREGAYQHLSKAQALEARGDYARAAKERAAADKQFAKARQRAYQEAGYYY